MIITDEKFIRTSQELFQSANISAEGLGKILLYIQSGEEIEITPEMKNASYSAEALTEYASALFSLYNLKTVLNRIITFFLKCKKFEELFSIMRCSTVADFYSAQKYVSTKHENYSFLERSFDRFIQIIHAVTIPTEIYMPFMLHILDARSLPSRDWQRPVREFLAKSDLIDVYQFAEKSRSVNAYSLLLECDTENAVRKLVNTILFGKGERSKLMNILLPYKRVVLPIVLPYLSSNDITTRLYAVKILLVYKSDENVMYQLTQIYLTDSVAKIRTEIQDACSIPHERLRIDTFADLISISKSFNTLAPEKFPALKYQNGETVGREVAGAVISFMTDNWKNLSRLVEVKEFTKFFTMESLREACDILYKSITKSDRYRLNFCLLFGNDKIIETEINKKFKKIKHLSLSPRSITVMGLSQNSAVRTFLYKVLNCGGKKYHKAAQSGLELASLVSGLGLEDFEDENAETYGMSDEGEIVTQNGTIRISDKLEVECTRLDKPFAQQIDKEIKRQIKRMEFAMIEGRVFRKGCFLSHIITHPILNRIASTLFFGEYKYGKLRKVFIVEGCTRGLDNQPYEISDDADIMICHPLELSEYFEGRRFNELFQAFPQAEREYFEPYPDELKFNRVERFNNYLVSALDMSKGIKSFGFTLAKPLDTGAITHFSKSMGGVVAIATFREPIYLGRTGGVTLSSIKFYSTNTSIKTFIPAKNKPLDIAGMDKRLFSEFLYYISRIVKGS